MVTNTTTILLDWWSSHRSQNTGNWIVLSLVFRKKMPEFSRGIWLRASRPRLLDSRLRRSEKSGLFVEPPTKRFENQNRHPEGGFYYEKAIVY